MKPNKVIEIFDYNSVNAKCRLSDGRTWQVKSCLERQTKTFYRTELSDIDTSVFKNHNKI